MSTQTRRKAAEEIAMSKTKTAERAQRTLTEREVSDIRAIRATGTARQLLALVERIAARRG